MLPSPEKFWVLEVIECLTEKLQRVHHTTEGGGNEMYEVASETFHHTFVEPLFSEFGRKL